MEASKPIIYIVDDDEIIRRSLGQILSSRGYLVQTYSSAKAFLKEEIPSNRPGCLLLDVQMPGMDGVELQNALSKTETALCIVFLTGYGSIPKSVTAIKAGAVNYLKKPCSAEDLQNAVTEAVEKSMSLFKAHEKAACLRERAALLSPRERQVFNFVVTGMLSKEIASKLGITERTVKAHRGKVMKKIAVHSIADLVHFADQLSLIEDRAIT